MKRTLVLSLFLVVLSACITVNCPSNKKTEGQAVEKHSIEEQDYLQYPFYEYPVPLDNSIPPPYDYPLILLDGR